MSKDRKKHYSTHLFLVNVALCLKTVLRGCHVILYPDPDLLFLVVHMTMEKSMRHSNITIMLPTIVIDVLQNVSADVLYLRDSSR